MEFDFFLYLLWFSYVLSIVNRVKVKIGIIFECIIFDIQLHIGF